MKRSPMKRGKPLQRKTPMKAAAFERADRKEAVAVRKVRMKSRGPKVTPIRRSAKGQECTLQIPGVCNRNPETTVWAHSNNYVDGKGAGIKARDEEGCFACHACHMFYDGGYTNSGWAREMIETQFNAARAKSQVILREIGLMK